MENPYKHDNCLPHDKEEELFNDCVDKELTKDLLPKLGCIPPWLSTHNNCDGIYEKNGTLNKSFYKSGAVYENYSVPTLYKDQNKAQKKCKKPCLKTTISVEQKLKRLPVEDVHYYVDFRFNTEVGFKEKVVAYDMFNFVVDVGSSLGLWLGLSILNITDAIIDSIWKLNLYKVFFKELPLI